MPKHSFPMFCHLILLFALLCLPNISTAQPTLDWTFGVGAVDMDIVEAITTDARGNIYVTGTLSGFTDFDPGPGTANVSTVRDEQAFLAKYGPDGSYKWAFSMGGTSTQDDVSAGVDLEIAPNGDIWILGRMEGTIDFDPGPGKVSRTATGNYGQMFIASYDSLGQLNWVKVTEGPSNTARVLPEKLHFGQDGDVYVTGGIYDTIDIDFGPSTLYIITHDLSVFVLKMDLSLQNIWTFVMPPLSTGSYDLSYGYDILPDTQGNVYVLGIFEGTLDFDPGSGSAIYSSGNGDALFLAKYDTAGSYQWAIAIKGNDPIFYYPSLGFDTSGNIYIGGGYLKTSDFDPGPGQVSLSTGAYADIFLAKYDTAGNYLWAFNFGGFSQSTDDNTGIRQLITDDDGNPIVTGYFDHTLDFDPGPDSVKLQSHGDSRDIFIAKYDDNGNYLWARDLGGNGPDLGYALTLDLKGSVLLAGTFQDTADLDPSAKKRNIISQGSDDFFLAKYILPCTGVPYNVNTGFCPGDVYMLGSQTITTPGTYSATLQNHLGCDSTVNLVLSHYPTYTLSDTAGICFGETLQFGTQTITQAGVYTETLPTQYGCDSNVTLTVTVTQLDTSLTVIGTNTLRANDPNANYQWLNCDVGLPIPGAVNRTFTPGANGNIALIVSKGNCSDTSACIAITNVGIDPNPKDIPFYIYPNPAKENIHLSFYLAKATSVSIRLFDNQGRVILNKELGTTYGMQNHSLDVSQLPAGIYHLMVQTGEGNVVRQLVIGR